MNKEELSDLETGIVWEILDLRHMYIQRYKDKLTKDEINNIFKNVVKVAIEEPIK